MAWRQQVTSGSQEMDVTYGRPAWRCRLADEDQEAGLTVQVVRRFVDTRLQLGTTRRILVTHHRPHVRAEARPRSHQPMLRREQPRLRGAEVNHPIALDQRRNGTLILEGKLKRVEAYAQNSIARRQIDSVVLEDNGVPKGRIN